MPENGGAVPRLPYRTRRRCPYQNLILLANAEIVVADTRSKRSLKFIMPKVAVRERPETLGNSTTFHEGALHTQPVYETKAQSAVLLD